MNLISHDLVLAYVEDPRGTPDLAHPELIDHLLETLRSGSPAALRDLLSRDNGYGDPLLYWLVKKDAPLVEKFAGTFGPDLELLEACFFGLQGRVRQLLEEQPECVMVQDSRSWGALDVVAHEGHTHLVQPLLEHGAWPHALKPLFWAAQNGYAEIVRLLVDQAPCSPSEKKEALSRAVYRNRPEVVQVLLESGTGADGLLAAAAYGSRTGGKVQILDLLLRHGAKINHRDSKGYTALYSQISYYGDGPSGEITQFLLKKGAEVDIFAASGLGLLQHLKELLEADPESVHQRSANGSTALHFAARGNQLEAARLLVAAGADATLANQDGDLPADLVRPTDGHFVTADTAPLRRFLEEQSQRPPR